MPSKTPSGYDVPADADGVTERVGGTILASDLPDSNCPLDYLRRELKRGQRMRVLDMAGFPPGSCAIDLVREDSAPSFLTRVLVADLLQVPPSCAIALD